MKLNQATVAAFLSAFLATTSAASSSSEHEEMKDKIASLLVAPKIRKMLVGFSAECNADWGALLASGYPTASYNAMTACPQAVVLSGNTATVDYSVCDPQFTESLTTACTAADGIIVSGIGEFKIDCIGKNNNGQSFTLVMKEVPECIAKSCDVSNWEAEKGNLIDSREVEEAISASMTDADCTFNSAGKVTGVLVFAVTSFAAAALMFF